MPLFVVRVCVGERARNALCPYPAELTAPLGVEVLISVICTWLLTLRLRRVRLLARDGLREVELERMPDGEGREAMCEIEADV